MMDQPGLPEDEHRLALAGLARLNRFTGIASQLYRHLRREACRNPGRTLRILDVASGSADLPLAWAVRARRDGLKFEITTTDISDFAIAEQQRLAKQYDVQINSVQADCLNDPLPGGFDVVTNSLFMHHLDEHDVGRLTERMLDISRGKVMICDLERSRSNLALVSVGAHLLSRSVVVHHDARWSVRGAFTRDELKHLVRAASGQDAAVRRVIPCRMFVMLRGRCAAVKESR
ncbi:methyltransferase domain-containing protein [Roseiconus nitratireducens]|uniref:Methyltransferase domain-containing protein n=1 Tax=Roseiconus nitratireducens TaxID=2605748 RepID=A0A5M6CVR4_9BACT|nr:methyltransferase domain-containing protein [Roseiconus nitratireducens]KAA5539334.1 methyltransferase domain-containing protein [Roseiconus nitratireducens]